MSTEVYSSYELRSLYGIAIIRSVNGLVDPKQKGIFADSIYNLASKLGLPGWIVELRHDATHDTLPSLALLRAGATELLRWFLVNYWSAQATYLQELSFLCLPDTVASIMEQTSTSKCSSTTTSSSFILSILIPIMMSSMVRYPRTSAIDSDASVTTVSTRCGNEETKKGSMGMKDQCELRLQAWWELIEEFDSLMNNFSHLLTYHFIMACLDIFIESSISFLPLTTTFPSHTSTDGESVVYAVEWALEMVAVWVRRVCAKISVRDKGCDDRGVDHSRELFEKFLKSLIDRIVTDQAVSAQNSWSYHMSPYYSTLLTLVRSLGCDGYQATAFVTVTCDQIFTQANRKRGKMEGDEHEKWLKKRCKVGESSVVQEERFVWRRCEGYNVWPIGVLPGHHNANDLHHIIRSFAPHS